MLDKVIKILEETLNDKTTIEEQMTLVNNDRIKKALKQFIENKNSIDYKEIEKLTENEKVRDFIELYVRNNNIKIVYNYYNDLSISNNQYEDYLNEISKFKVLTREEEQELFMKYNNSNDEEEKKQIKNEIIEHNLKLVNKIAKKYINNKVDILDLIGEGNIGLIEAIDKFDYAKGYKFSTYAIHWIRQKIKIYISNQVNMIRVPLYVNEIALKIKKEENYNYLITGKKDKTNEKTIEKMSEKYRVTPNIMKNILYFQEVLSLDQTIKNGTEDTGYTLIDSIADKDDSTEEQVLAKIENKNIREYLKNCNLTEKEKEVIEKRFGFDNGSPMTLSETGKNMGMSKERVRIIEAKALRKLRYPSMSKKIKF